MDQPEEKCSKLVIDPDTTACITRFIEKKAGCTLAVQGSDKNNVSMCKNSTAINKFLEMNREYEKNDTLRK